MLKHCNAAITLAQAKYPAPGVLGYARRHKHHLLHPCLNAPALSGMAHGALGIFGNEFKFDVRAELLGQSFDNEVDHIGPDMQSELHMKANALISKEKSTKFTLKPPIRGISFAVTTAKLSMIILHRVLGKKLLKNPHEDYFGVHVSLPPLLQRWVGLHGG
ncbi:MAG: hypothetical protein HHJ16_14315 [Polaromonas sp.]|uniref:hypothetical protein n=1 Tax=Polaromonas sp. TaxID=1869339 RepID=UPI0017AAAC31|nr:hypothetical protein [Polaromonas sp.]NMM11431.1 hypothetical protein [Polaromonas sp.]